MILTINGIQAALKKGSSIEYVSENRLFTDADDYSMEIELPLADCPRNLGIFGHLTRKDVDMGDIFFDAVLQDTNFFKNSASRTQSQTGLNSAEAQPILSNRGAVVITGITNESVKVHLYTIKEGGGCDKHSKHLPFAFIQEELLLYRLWINSYKSED